MNAKFEAPWSSTVKLITIAILGIFIIAALAAPPVGGPLAILFLVLGLLIWLRGYSVGGGKLVIRGTLWKKTYDLSRLNRIEAIPFGTSGSIRAVASGGYFGFIGLFRSPNLGTYMAYVTDPANAVLMEFMNSTIIVVSPSDPIKFVTLVEDEYSRIQHKAH